jgi:hypothetical protein
MQLSQIGNMNLVFLTIATAVWQPRERQECSGRNKVALSLALHMTNRQIGN